MKWVRVQGDGYCRWARIGKDGKEIADASNREAKTKLGNGEQNSTDKTAPLTDRQP